MTDTYTKPFLWSTAVKTAVAAPPTHDAEAIGVHLLECRACQGRWFSLACAGEAMRRFLAPRLITTVLAAVAVWAVVTVLV